MIEETWLRTDERLDVISSLKMFTNTLQVLKPDPSYWKWSIISLHSALQSMMAFHLSFGNDLLVMSQKDAEAWLEAHYNETAYPESKMDNFLNLYKKIKSNEILGYKFCPAGQQGSSVKRLNNFRNEFIHFMPKGWSIELSGIPDIFLDCLDIIKALGNANPSRWEDDLQYRIFNSNIEEAMSKTNEYKNH
jgi:hypothetical protein